MEYEAPEIRRLGSVSNLTHWFGSEWGENWFPQGSVTEPPTPS